MKTDKRIENEVEKTLRALDGIERAEPKPFLYTRLKARIEQRAESKNRVMWHLRPAYLVASLVLLVGLNVWAVVQYNRQKSSSAVSQPTIDNMASDYGLSISVDIQ